MKKGYFVVFEGLDDYKEKIEYIDAKLKERGFPSTIVRPTKTKFSELKQYYDYLFSEKERNLYSEILLSLAELYHIERNYIKPAVEKGEIVLKEKYTDDFYSEYIPLLREDKKDLGDAFFFIWLKNLTGMLYRPHLTMFEFREPLTRREKEKQDVLKTFYKNRKFKDAIEITNERIEDLPEIIIEKYYERLKKLENQLRSKGKL